MGDEAAELRVKLQTRELEDGLDKTEQKFTNWAGAIKSALAAAGIVEFGKWIANVAKEGDAASDAFDALSISITAAQQATGNEVSQLQLAKIANQAMIGGLRLTSESYADLARFAKRAGDATGRDFGDVLSTLTRAMITGRTTALRPFIGDIELTGTTAEKQAQILQILREKTDDIRGSTETAGDAVSRLETKWSDVNTEFALGVTKSKALIDAVDGLTKSLGFAGEGAEGAGSAIGSLVGYAVQLNPLVIAVEQIASAFGHLASAARTARTTTEQYMDLQLVRDMAEERGEVDLEGSAAFFERRERERAAERERMEREASPEFQEALQAEVEGWGRGGGGGGGGGGRRQSPAMAAWERAEERRRQEYDQARADFAREMEAQANEADIAAEQERAKQEIIRETREEEEQALTDFLNEQNDLRLEAEREAAEAREQMMEEEMNVRAQYTQQLIATARAAVVEGKSAGGVMAALTAAGLEQIATWAEQKAAWEVAEAIAAAARYDYGGAALHLAAAAGYGALALGASAIGGRVSEMGSVGTGGKERSGPLGSDLGGPGLGQTSSSGGGGSRPIQVTVVYQPSIGGFVPDAHVRDLLDVIGDGISRGYGSV